LGLDAGDDFCVVDEVALALLGSPRIAEHFAQFFNSMGGD
jgi:hypothetical protein